MHLNSFTMDRTLFWITIIGTFLFGISGALAAIKRQLDIFGIAVIACVSSLGGSTIRDILIGHYPLAWVQDSRHVIAVLLGVTIALCLFKTLSGWVKLLFLIDTFGIGIFTIISINKCLALGISPGLAVLFGSMSTITGSVLRDVLCNEVPMIFRKELSAIAAIIGGLCYILLMPFLPLLPTALVSISIIIGLRLASRKYNISLPVIGLQE